MKKSTLAFLKKHQLIILAMSFFLIWKLLLVSILWQDRATPPEPDDSYSYISTIASASACPHSFLCNQQEQAFVSNYSSYIQFSYRIILGGTARILNFSPEKMYEASFYIGTILLAGALLLFLRSLTKNPVIISLAILALTLYHGSGEIHGFYWVVPSFFMILLFFCIMAFVMEDQPPKYQFWTTFFLVPIFIGTHPMSGYFLIIPIIYTGIQSIFEKKIIWHTARKSLFILIIGSLSIVTQSFVMAEKGQSDPYGMRALLPKAAFILSQFQADTNTIVSYNITKKSNPAVAVSQEETTITSKSTESYLDNRMQTLRIAYFGWFFPHWVIILPFMGILFLLYWKKEYKILSIYTASLIFFISSTIFNQFGFRTGIILWPITYTIYAFGLYHVILFIKEYTTIRPMLYKISIGAIIFGCIIFVLLNILYALTVNTNMNARANYLIDKAFESYLLKNTTPDDTLYIPRLVRQSSLGSELYSRNNIIPPEQNPDYIISLKSKSFQSGKLNNSVRAIINKLLTLGGQSPLPIPASTRTSLIPPSYTLVASFGDILVYRNANQ